MAYRQLCAVAFMVLGLVGTGCGGNTLGTQGTPSTDDSVPPSADDPPPSGADDNPPSADDAPPDSSDEAPPNGADTPPGGGGGRLQQLCEDACEVLSAIGECEGSDLDPMGQEVCDNGGCAVAVEPSEPIECLDQIEALFDCIARLPDICMPSEQQAAQCQDDVMAFSDCAEDQEPVDEPTPTETCTMALGCECLTDCASCQCALGADAGTTCDQVCANR